MHKTFEHKCNICNTQGQACSHTILKCSNCGENHMASSNICLFKTHPEKRSYKHAQNMQKIQQQQQQNNATSSNSFHVLIDNTTRQW